MSPTQFYPTRLLNLSGPDPSKVYLQDSGATKIGPYASLSHCWGGMQPIQLTAETEAALRAGLPIQQLPKTFREAIYVCRRLDASYIWIDSLCILQDSMADWEKEAALMHKVYSHAHFNVAATGARNCYDGLGFERDSRLQIPFRINAGWQWPSNSLGLADKLPKVNTGSFPLLCGRITQSAPP